MDLCKISTSDFDELHVSPNGLGGAYPRIQHHFLEDAAPGATIRFGVNARETKPEIVPGMFPSKLNSTQVPAFNVAMELSGLGYWELNMRDGKLKFDGWWSAMLGNGNMGCPESVDAWEKIIHPNCRREFSGAWHALLHEYAICFECLYCVVNEKGEQRWISSAGKVIEHDLHGCAVRVAGIHRDVTEQKKHEMEMSVLRAIYENVSDAIVVLNSGKELQEMNHAFSQKYPCAPDGPIDRDPEFRKFIEPGKHMWMQAWDEVLCSGTWRGEIRMRERSGRIVHEWLTVSGLKNSSGQMVNYVAAFSPISNLVMDTERVRYLEQYDSLTGLPGPVLLAERIDGAMAYAKRYGARMAVMCVGLKGFDKVNKTYGLTVGDQLLKSAVVRMRNLLDKDMLICRQGGDEFSLVLPDVRGKADAAQTAEKIIAAISRSYFICGWKIEIGAVVGISVYPDDGEQSVCLLDRARSVMYEAQGLGRSVYRFHISRKNEQCHQMLLNGFEMDREGVRTILPCGS